ERVHQRGPLLSLVLDNEHGRQPIIHRDVWKVINCDFRDTHGLDPSFARRLDTTSPRGLPRGGDELSHCVFSLKADREGQSLRADFGGVFGNGTGAARRYQRGGATEPSKVSIR